MIPLRVDGEPVTDEHGRVVRDPADTEREADFVRTRLAPAPTAEQQIKTPDDVVHELEWAKHLTAKSAGIVRDADRALRQLRRIYNRRLVAAMQNSSAKSVDERRMQAEVVLDELLAQVDDAEVVLEYTKRVGRGVEQSMSVLQSEGRLIEATYRMAGTGREA